jgi:hypothetical protein
VGLLLLHLLEVGHPLRVHLRSSIRSNEVVYLPTAMVPSSEAQHIRRSLIHPSAWRDCMKSPHRRINRLSMRRLMAAYTNASPLAHNLS